MKFREMMPLIFVSTGVLIAIFSSLMTYLIIDEPIGLTMFSKIIMMVLFLLPFIAYFAYHISKKLKKESDELSLMIGSFAHDFKTPLTIIDGYLEEIEDGMVSKEKLPETIKKLKNETRFLNDLTVDILDFTEARKKETAQELVMLRPFIESEVLPLVSLNKGLILDVEIEADFEIHFNKMDLKKVCLNLLQNSMKFTKEGTIMIRTDKKSIMIEDSGIGIDKAYQTKVFEPYFTVDKSKNREKSGFGLGLAIVKHLCKKNGYQVKIDSNFKKGTRVMLVK